VTVVVPHGNGVEKNAAMRALGATLVEHGDDFQAAAEHAAALAVRDGLLRVPSFHPDLVAGVASASMELFAAVDAIDVAYVPIGMGSGACAMAAARAALGLRTRIVGVVSRHAPAYARSLAAGAPCVHPARTVLADGLACSTPDATALALLGPVLDHVVEVSDREVAQAMRTLFACTHNAAEGAGAAAWAAAWAERATLRGQRVAVLLTGGNVDSAQFARVLTEPTGTWQA
jgi:threonine dehydratase